MSLFTRALREAVMKASQMVNPLYILSPSTKQNLSTDVTDLKEQRFLGSLDYTINNVM